MPTHFTIDEALDNLMYTSKVVILKQKLTKRFLQEDGQLNFLLSNVEDSSTKKLIDNYCQDNYFNNDFE